ncbi:MAG: FG-GAP-like repeat-containing protein [Myxococcota bacterium]|nr:FG-GAP-like repeat-containing protein [Myxococcota bacterium]
MQRFFLKKGKHLSFLIGTIWAISGCENIALPIPGPTQSGGRITPGDRVSDAGFLPPDAGWPERNPGKTACRPPLEISPKNLTTTPVALTSFSVTGGTGNYVFDLLKSESGGRINETTGAYLSGQLQSTNDIVRVRDENCIGTSSAAIEIVSNMNVLPTRADVPPYTEFQIQVDGGSGEFKYEMYRSPSGGTVSLEGFYSAGDRDGEDIIRVTDTSSNELYDLFVRVDISSEITANPTEVHVPVGNTYRLRITGGSGSYRLISDNPNVELLDLDVYSNLPGTVAFQIEDEFTGQFGDAFVTFVLPQTVTTTRGGDLTNRADFDAPGDIDGDGHTDLVFGLPEADHTGNNAGAVYIYRGQADGLSTQPELILGGTSRGDEFGSKIATGDLTGDGIDDLIVSAPKADINAVNSGGIYIFRGKVGGLYEEERFQVIGGRGDEDNFGAALELCDFNGDGRLDIAVTAPFAEDRALQNVRTDQGALYIFLNYPDFGFLSNADQIFYGSLRRNNGDWTGETNLQLGQAIAAGDFNNDGFCEVAVSSTNFMNGTGLVYVHTGSDSGVSIYPKYAYQGSDANAQLGQTILFGDITNDERDELILAEPGRAGGSIYVFRGQDTIATDDVMELGDVNEAEWSFSDPTANNLTGFSLAVGDINRDDINDLIFGRPLGEKAGQTDDTGAVTIFTGRAGPMPSRMPYRTYGGMSPQDFFGLSVSVIEDLDGDRINDLVVFASRSELYGPFVGAPLFVSSDQTQNFEALEIPSDASGVRVGASLAVVGDINDDRDDDLVVGAPGADLRGRGLNTGAALIYLGGQTGFDLFATATIDSFPELSSQDEFGSTVAKLGDFDGDGIDDYAISAPGDDMPGQFAIHLNANGCRAQSRTNSGAIFIFRGTNQGTVETNPAFVYWGPQANLGLKNVAENIDFNGDGKADLVMGMPSFNRGNRGNAGLLTVIYGQPISPDRTKVLCRSDFQFRGLRANDRLGTAVSSAGDIDNDGCTDIAVSSPGEGLFANGQDTNEGYLRVFFGGSPNCAQSSPVVVTFGSSEPNAQVGFALTGGSDMDGDTIPDLAISSITTIVAAETVGSVWMLPGDHILGSPVTPVRDDVAPPTVHPFAPANANANYRLNGETAAGNFGATLRMIPDASGPGIAGLAIGAPRYRYSDRPLTGAVMLHRFNQAGNTLNPRGINAQPFVAVTGETNRSGGQMGSAISTGRIAGKRVVVVGAEQGSGNGVDQGAVYVISPDSL